MSLTITTFHHTRHALQEIAAPRDKRRMMLALPIIETEIGFSLVQRGGRDKMSAEKLHIVCYREPVNVGEVKGLLEKGADPNGYKNQVSVRPARTNDIARRITR